MDIRTNNKQEIEMNETKVIKQLAAEMGCKEDEISINVILRNPWFSTGTVYFQRNNSHFFAQLTSTGKVKKHSARYDDNQ